MSKESVTLEPPVDVKAIPLPEDIKMLRRKSIDLSIASYRGRSCPGQRRKPHLARGPQWAPRSSDLVRRGGPARSIDHSEISDRLCIPSGRNLLAPEGVQAPEEFFQALEG